MPVLCCPVGASGNENSRGSHEKVYWIILLVTVMVTVNTLITGSKGMAASGERGAGVHACVRLGGCAWSA